MEDETLQLLYQWVDDIPPVSRHKRNIMRDFRDEVLVADIFADKQQRRRPKLTLE